jgi:hypothetical protein
VPQTSRTPDPKPRSVSFHIAYREVFGPPGPLWPRDHPGGTDCGEGDCTGEARVATTGTRIGVGDCGEGDCTGDSAPVLQALWTAADCGTEECTSEG